MLNVFDTGRAKVKKKSRRKTYNTARLVMDDIQFGCKRSPPISFTAHNSMQTKSLAMIKRA